MARFGVNDADNYGSNGGGGYFSLKNDKDTARVRFLYDGIDDVEGYAVHEITYKDKKRAVNCLRDYGQPMDVCPMCAAKMPVRVKYYIPLFDIASDKVVIWERGKQFGNKLSSMCSRYPHLASHIFEIERNGKTGDQQTTYEIYEIEKDDTSVEDFEIPEVLGGVVMDKNADEMQYFLDRGTFPDDTDAPIRRGGSSESAEYTRRTPATSNGRREAF